MNVRPADGQSLGWAKQAVGADFDYANAVAVDGSGNVYVTGPYNRQCGCGSSITFDAGGPNETTLPGMLSSDAFVAKYNSSGALVWAKSASTFGYDESFGIAVDAEGNSYVAIVRSGIGAQVVKFDNGGSEVWTTTLPLSGYAYAIAVDAAGNSYITGYGADIQTGGTLVTVWKLDSGGAPLWTRQATGVHTGSGAAISVDSAGNSYVAGHVSGDATFGAGEPTETSVSGEVMFVAKYDSSGSLIWVNHSTNAFAGGIALDTAGDIHVTGQTGLGGAIFGMNEPNETSVLGAFLTKFAVNGQLLWARSIWENASTAGTGVAVDLAGHSLVTGSILGASFTANYDPDGNLVWFRQPSNDQLTGGGSGGGGIATDNEGNAYVVGALVGTVIFGAGEPSEVVLSSSSIIDRDIFVAKYLNDETVGNRPPVADDQPVGTPEDTPLAITLTATDPDGDPLTYSIVAGPTHGMLDVGNLPSVIYTPNANYNGPDAFTFRACDGTACDDATVAITVSPVNDPPVAHAQVVSTSQDVPVTIVLSASDVDGDPLTFHILNGPAHGSVAPAISQGTVVYTPQSGYVGTDAFTFRAHDGTVFSTVQALVSLSVHSTSFVCGALTSGSISALGEIDTFRFVGQAGQIISIALASTGGFATNQSQSSASLTLFTPSGAIVGALRSNNQATFTLPVDGTYVVQVRATNLRTLGSYNVTRHCLFPPPTGAPVLQCGVLQPGSIGVPGEVDLYSFTGQAGQIVGLTLASTGGFATNQSGTSAALTLFTPTGALLGAFRSNSQANFTLPATGTYVVRVNATNLATSGTYNVSLQCLLPTPTPAPLLQCGALQPGSIGAPGEVDLYSFTGQAGQIVGLTLASTGGFATNRSGTSAALTLFAPTGALLGAFRSNSQANFTLPATGTYVVRVNATNLATTGTYNVRLQCPA